MTATDLITLTLSLFLLLRGGFRGFLASLLGPIALIVATVVSYVYYLLTNNIVISLCIGLLGPFLLGWGLRSFVHSWSLVTNSQKKISPLSRVSGALLTWGWGMVIIIITVLLLSMMPPINKQAEFVYKDIHQSYLYRIIKPWDTSAVDKSNVDSDMKSLSEDKRIQDIINDPQIIKAINNKDYASLMSNQKIASLIKDPELIKKMMGIYKQVMQEKMNTQ